MTAGRKNFPKALAVRCVEAHALNIKRGRTTVQKGTTMKKQTLVQAVHLALSGKSKSLTAALCLGGLPVGAWAPTTQAVQNISGALPLRSERTYTVHQFIAAAYREDFAGRYELRPDSEALAEAARIEATAG